MQEPKAITKSLKKKETEAIEDVAALTKKFKVKSYAAAFAVPVS